MQRFDGRQLRRLRESTGKSPEHLAVACGRSAQTISLYERSRISPPSDVVGILADELGCLAGDLFSDEEAVVA
jgi:transcriptional regulator with XRE-family HTH domain